MGRRTGVVSTQGIGLRPSYGTGPHLIFCAGWRAESVNLTVGGTFNCLTECVIFIVYAQLTNMAAGRTIQIDGCGLETHDVRDPFLIRKEHLTASQSIQNT